MKRSRPGVEVELDVNMARVLMLLSRGATEVAVDKAPQSPDRVFECKTCNRQFSSFQALGGHRASHKKPRLLEEQQGLSRPAKPRVHECSICGLEFSLGQALGGHMRRHRALNNYSQGFQSPVDVDKPESSDTISNEKRVFLDLDLNLTPMENEDEIRLLTFSLGPPLVQY